MQTLLRPNNTLFGFIGLYFTKLIRSFITDKETENVMSQKKMQRNNEVLQNVTFNRTFSAT